MDSKEIGQWCLDNKKMIGKIILKYDRYPDHFQDNFNHLTMRLMKKGTSFNSNKGRKFSTYAYTILVREMIEYINWKTCKLSYPHVCLTMNKYIKARTDLEKDSLSFGAIPDFIEAKAGAKDLTNIEEGLDKEILKRKIQSITKYILTPTQRKLFEYRYNDNLELWHTLQECADAFGFTTTRGAQLERKVIQKIRDYLYLNPAKEDKRINKINKKERGKNIEEARRDTIWS